MACGVSSARGISPSEDSRPMDLKPPLPCSHNPPEREGGKPPCYPPGKPKHRAAAPQGERGGKPPCYPPGKPKHRAAAPQGERGGKPPCYPPGKPKHRAAAPQGE